MHADDLKKPSWNCVHFVEPVQVDSLVESLHAGQPRIANVDARPIRSDRDLFAALRDAFEFPSYFGMNWDAVYECLRDLSWLPDGGHVLLVANAPEVWGHAYSTAGRLVEAWLFSGEHWSRSGVAFHLLFCRGSPKYFAKPRRQP
jgi:hypothetical protein